MSYEEWFCNKVRKFAASPIKGRISTIIDRLLPIKLVSWYMMKFSHKNVYYKAIEQMESYHADIVFLLIGLQTITQGNVIINHIVLFIVPIVTFVMLFL